MELIVNKTFTDAYVIGAPVVREVGEIFTAKVSNWHNYLPYCSIYDEGVVTALKAIYTKIAGETPAIDLAEPIGVTDLLLGIKDNLNPTPVPTFTKIDGVITAMNEDEVTTDVADLSEVLNVNDYLFVGGIFYSVLTITDGAMTVAPDMQVGTGLSVDFYKVNMP